MEGFIFLLIVATVLGCITGSIAQSKGASFFEWWLFGTALFIVAFPMALMLKPKESLTRQQQLRNLYIYVNAQQHGPYPLDSIVEWYQSGKLKPNDMIFSQGQWLAIASFFGHQQATQPASNMDELDKLASLKAKGVINEEEYEAKKQQLLAL